jgi:hypothetical protein
MYKPHFNHVLVELEIDKWARGSDDSFGGEVYREGKVTDVGGIMSVRDYPVPDEDLGDIRQYFLDMIGKTIMWNEGHEAGKVFEHDGKKYALIYWWDIVGVKDEQ